MLILLGTEDRGSVVDDGDLKTNSKHARCHFAKGTASVRSKSSFVRSLLLSFGEVFLTPLGCFALVVICWRFFLIFGDKFLLNLR